MCKANTRLRSFGAKRRSECLHLQFAAAIIGDMNVVNVEVRT